MGHDMALYDESTKQALVGYKQRWMCDLDWPITPEAIREVATYPEPFELCAQWAERPERGEVRAAHEPIWDEVAWPWQDAHGRNLPGWRIFDVFDDREELRAMWVVADDGVVMPHCTEECEAMPECVACHKPKKPWGRSAPHEMSHDICTWTCPGYTHDPQPGHLWPGELAQARAEAKGGDDV